MKEYKGYGGGRVTVDGDNIFIKQLFVRENCTFGDIEKTDWKEPAALTNGRIDIFTNEHSSPPHTIFFLKKARNDFVELYNLIAEKTGRLRLDEQLAENEVAANEKAQREKERTDRLDEEGVVYCPKCKSTSLSSNKKGFGIGKAVVGAALTGGLGLMAGNIGAKKVRVTCLKCGHEFWAGKG